MAANPKTPVGSNVASEVIANTAILLPFLLIKFHKLKNKLPFPLSTFLVV